jgi:hypothetical protein
MVAMTRRMAQKAFMRHPVRKPFEPDPVNTGVGTGIFLDASWRSGHLALFLIASFNPTLARLTDPTSKGLRHGPP